MFRTTAQGTTKRTSLARVSRIDVLNGNPCGLRFILDKGLQLPESPTVQPSSNAFPTLDVLSDMGQIFEDNFTRFKSFGFFNNRFAHFVVRMFNLPLLFTGDLSERLFCTLTAVGLQATAKRKTFIPTMSEFPTAKEFTAACGGEIIFSDIDPDNDFRFNWFNFGKFKNQVEKPIAFLKISSASFGIPISNKQIGAFHYPIHFDSTSEGIERKKVFLKRVRPFIKVNRSSTKVNFWNKIFFDLPQRFLGLIGFTDTKNCVAAHLKPREVFPRRSA